MIASALTTVLVGLIVWKLIQQHLKFFKIPKPFYQIPLLGGTVGHSISIIRREQHKIFDLCQQFGQIMLLGPVGLPMLMVSDPEEIKRIHNDTKTFPRSDFLQNMLVGVLDYGILYCFNPRYPFTALTLGLANIPSGSIHKVPCAHIIL
jgi:Kef-type K+ transport system membrane component KefB